MTEKPTKEVRLYEAGAKHRTITQSFVNTCNSYSTISFLLPNWVGLWNVDELVVNKIQKGGDSFGDKENDICIINTYARTRASSSGVWLTDRKH